MTFTQMLDEIGIRYHEAEFRADMKPPYMVWERNCESLFADSVVVFIEDSYSLVLVHSRGDDDTELTVESVLDAHHIDYSKSRTWIGTSQKVWLVTYGFDGREEW